MRSRTHVLVTGASRGIGRAIAEHLANRGCRIALHFRSQRAAAEEVLRSLSGEGHEAFAADLGESDGAEKLWHAVAQRFGRVDALINNAGIYEEHPPLASSPAEWARAWESILRTNLLAPATLSHLAGRAMAQQGEEPHFGRGRIVNISSRGAFRGEPEAPAYGASKAGLNAMSQSMAKALAAVHVYIYSVAPGWVETDMASAHLAAPGGAEILAQHPLERVTQPDEVARAVAFCALDAPAAMTGAILDVNGASYLRT